MKRRVASPTRVAALFVFMFMSTAASAINLSQCITIEGSGGNAYMRNGCTQKLNVKWIDEGVCRTGCAETVAGGSKATITPPKGSFDIAACVYPAWISPKWRGGKYQCE